MDRRIATLTAATAALVLVLASAAYIVTDVPAVRGYKPSEWSSSSHLSAHVYREADGTVVMGAWTAGATEAEWRLRWVRRKAEADATVTIPSTLGGEACLGASPCWMRHKVEPGPTVSWALFVDGSSVDGGSVDTPKKER